MDSQLALPLYNLGGTGIHVTPVGLGVMQFSGGAGMMGSIFPVMTQDEKNALVKSALQGGINWFDTAELYGFGQSERNLSQALQTMGIEQGQVTIATKWWPLFRSASNLADNVASRLDYLQPYPIDLYYVHQPFSFSSPEAEMNAMADLVEAGKIRAVGVSNFSAKRMRRAQAALAKRGLHLAANQVHYSLAHRKIESNGILQAVKELGITIVAYTPLEYGLLSGVFHKNPSLVESKTFYRRIGFRRQLERTRPLVAALEEIASAHHTTPAQVALNWLVTFHGETVVAIPGATKVSQVEQNAGAMKFTLSEAELQRLDQLSRQFM